VGAREVTEKTDVEWILDGLGASSIPSITVIARKIRQESSVL